MDLLLWRGAETAKSDEADADDNLKTPLNERGHKHAMRMAAWIREHRPKNLKVITSPASSTVAMAKMVTRDATINRRIGPDAQAADLLAVAGWPDDHPAVLMVAHQPALGNLTSLLLSGESAPWTFKKASLWWFSNRTRAGETQTVLRAVLTPEMVRTDPGDAGVVLLDPAKVTELMPSIQDIVLRNVLQ